MPAAAVVEVVPIDKLVEVGIVKITELPPAVNLYLPADASVILLVPVSVARLAVCVWLPLAAVVAVVPKARSDLLFQVYFSPVVTSETSVPPLAAVLLE